MFRCAIVLSYSRTCSKRICLHSQSMDFYSSTENCRNPILQTPPSPTKFGAMPMNIFIYRNLGFSPKVTLFKIHLVWALAVMSYAHELTFQICLALEQSEEPWLPPLEDEHYYCPCCFSQSTSPSIYRPVVEHLQLQVQWHHLQPSKEQSCVVFADVKKNSMSPIMQPALLHQTL